MSYLDPRISKASDNWHYADEADAIFFEAQKWIQDYEKRTTGAIFQFTSERQKEFKNISTETLIRDPYFLGMGDKVFDGVLEDIIALRDERNRREINLAIFLEGIGAGKCLSGDTLIPTNKGFKTLLELKPLSSKPNKFSDHSILVNTINGTKYSDSFYENSETKGLEIETFHGHILKGTLKHLIEIRKEGNNYEWKELSNLKLNDEVGICFKEGIFGENNKFSKEEAYLFGYCIGDGHINFSTYPSGQISADFTIDKKCPEFKDQIYKKAESVGMSIHPIKDKRRENYTFRLKYYKEEFFSNRNNYQPKIIKKSRWPKELIGNITYKSIPKEILESKKEILSSFIRGWYDADGSVDKRGNILISSVNKNLISKLQIILLNFGIYSSLRLKKTICKGKRGITWRLKINMEFSSIFMREIGFEIKHKIEKYNSIKIRRNPSQKYHIDWDRKVFYIPIVSIKDIKEKFYDLSIPDNKQFIGNGFIVHNTTKASILMWLLWFDLTMLGDPQAYYGLAPRSVIALMMMSRSETQARRVTFTEVWNRFQSPFNKDYFPPAPQFNREIRIEANNTCVFAGTSSALSALGYNLFGGVIDEASFLEVVEDSKKQKGEAFDAAEDIYYAIYNRMLSRFAKGGKLPGLLCMVSSPKFPDDFLHRKIAEAEKLGDDSGIFWRRRSTWEAKGLNKYKFDSNFYIDTEMTEVLMDEETVQFLEHVDESLFPLNLEVEQIQKISKYLRQVA
jgi:intein/homing endonuclease